MMLDSTVMTEGNLSFTAAGHEERANKHANWVFGRSLRNSFALAGADTLGLCFSLVLGGAFRYLFFGYTMLPIWAWSIVPAWWLGAGLSGLLPGWGLSAVDHLKRLIGLLTVLFSVGTLAIFFSGSPDSISRLTIGATWAFALILVPLCRTVVRHILCSRKKYGVPTIIFGRGAAVADAATRLLKDRALGYIPVGVCTNDELQSIDGLPVKGGLDEYSPFAPAAVLATDGLGKEESRKLLANVLQTYRNVMLLPNLADLPSLLTRPRDVGGIIGLEVSQTLLNPVAKTIKRVIGLAIVMAMSPIWLPVCCAICIAIWLEDRESPIFKQERIGQNGVPFFAYKFRTMVVDAEDVLKRTLAADTVMRKEWEDNFKFRKDPRVTRTGRFLRRSSLDELPQLVNVLLGQMALVGPRPLPLYHLEKLPAYVGRIRQRVRPGITGLWQVSGRSDIGIEGMIKWDEYYVKNWSIWLDIVIAVRTIKAVVLGTGAR